MKFAFSFVILATLLVWIANPITPGWRWIFFWPAANLYVASVAYFVNSPICFGKRSNGLLSPLNFLFFLPYVVALWCVWFLFAKHSRENAYDQVNSELWVGRRLDNAEARQTEFDNIVDLTAEFPEPQSFRQRNFLPFYMLDGAVPEMSVLKSIAEQVSQLPGKTFVHCAQGHGRTGLVAVAILLEKNKLTEKSKSRANADAGKNVDDKRDDSKPSVESCLDELKCCRPGIHCNKRQFKYLCEYEKQYYSDR